MRRLCNHLGLPATATDNRRRRIGGASSRLRSMCQLISSSWISAVHHNIMPANKQFSLTISTQGLDLITITLESGFYTCNISETLLAIPGSTNWWTSDEKKSSTMLCTLNDDKSRNYSDDAEKLDLASWSQPHYGVFINPRPPEVCLC